MPLIIVRNDITTMRVDAIVNAANESLLGGGGVDGCIHRAAGPELLAECRRLGGCRTGEAKLTRGYRLPCKYIIHTVGPVWHGGDHGEQEQLVSCYRTSLALARKHHCQTVAFPLISSGVYGYPKEQALRTAMNTIGAFLLEHDMTVYLVIFDRSAYQISSRLFADIAAYIDDHYVDAHTDFIRSRPCPASIPVEAQMAPSPAFSPASRPPRSLDDRLKHLDAGFSETLLTRIDRSGKKDSEIYKRANVDRKLFSKIQGRFSTRLQLSSSNTSEVIQKRLLVKTDEAKAALAKVWQEKGDILRNQLAFDPTTTTALRPFTSEEEFVDNYPFVPWHYQILQKVFESIRTKGAAGKQLAMGERSQLEAFQTAAQQISAQGLDSLVPFWRFYAAIESFLEPAVSRTITQACQNGILDEFDGNLLKTLFLIRYVETLKSTLDNLVTLSIDRIDADKVELRRRVEKSLNTLERLMLIARVEDKYVFLTNEEKEIENEIRNVDVDFSAINKKLASIIFDDILKSRKYRYPANKQDFDISRFLNGHPLDGAVLNDLVVKILTPKDPTYSFYNSDATCRPYTSEGDGCILIRLPEEGRTWSDIDLVVQTEKFLKDNAGQRPEQATLLSEKARENSNREKLLRVQLESLLAEADVWAIGERLPKKSSTPSNIVDEACRYVIENTFGKLKMLRPFNGDISREIHALLTVENDTELDLGNLEESNPDAMREVETWISMNIEYNKPVYLRDILNHFARRPYGWPEDEVKLLVARLACKGKFSFSQQNNNVERKQAWELFNNSRRHSELRLHKVRRHDEAQVRKAAQTMADIAQQPFNEREEPALVEHIRQVFEEWKQELNVFRAKAEGGNNPGKNEIESGLRLLNAILNEKEDFALIEKVSSLKDELLDFSEDREDLVDFYRKQFATWQKLGAALNGSFKSNRSALEKDAAAVKALGELESIWQMPEPYKHLNRITPLIEQVQNVNHQLVEQHRQHALERIDARIEESRQRLLEAHATSELQNSVLLPMQKARKRAEVSQSIPEILAEQQETKALQMDADKKINLWIDELRKKQEAQLRAANEAKRAAESEQTYVVVEKPVIQPVPKKTHLVNVASEMRNATGGEVLETTEQVEKALDTLRTTLLAAIKAGDRIRLQ